MEESVQNEEEAPHLLGEEDPPASPEDGTNRQHQIKEVS
jgi:hypothetical protein